MSKITEIYNLNKTQAEVDFVDIDIDKDTPLFIDPHFLANRYDAWSQNAVSYIRSFFQKLVNLINNDELNDAKDMFSYLDEPNETCLGLSTGAPRGRSVNRKDIEAIFGNLVRSQAVKKGLVEDLQDTMIFVDGVDRDKLSDITTNVIKEKLISYTQQQCKMWGIELQSGVQSGFYWSAKNSRWENMTTDMLVYEGRKLLLVPKGVISFCNNYTPAQYHQHFVLNFLKNEQLRLRTALVKKRVNRTKKTETEYVTKKDVKDKISSGDKMDLRNFTMRHPAIFKEFKNKKQKPARSLRNADMTDIVIEDTADFLAARLKKLPTGKNTADEYEHLITGILELLFYPDLICPQKQVQINQGRKRIDITFDNAASAGSLFDFHKVHKIPCQYIMVECKNYSSDPKNPEVDQLMGRFSANRGKVGILVFRDATNRDLLLQRCKDAYKDKQELILPLDDGDLIEGLGRIKDASIYRPLDEILRNLSREIQMG